MSRPFHFIGHGHVDGHVTQVAGVPIPVARAREVRKGYNATCRSSIL
jgi:hypothetical protein